MLNVVHFIDECVTPCAEKLLHVVILFSVSVSQTCIRGDNMFTAVI